MTELIFESKINISGIGKKVGSAVKSRGRANATKRAISQLQQKKLITSSDARLLNRYVKVIARPNRRSVSEIKKISRSIMSTNGISPTTLNLAGILYETTDSQTSAQASTASDAAGGAAVGAAVGGVIGAIVGGIAGSAGGPGGTLGGAGTGATLGAAVGAAAGAAAGAVVGGDDDDD